MQLKGLVMEQLSDLVPAGDVISMELVQYAPIPLGGLLALRFHRIQGAG